MLTLIILSIEVTVRHLVVLNASELKTREVFQVASIGSWSYMCTMYIAIREGIYNILYIGSNFKAENFVYQTCL